MDNDNRQIVKDSELFWGLSEAQIDRLMELCREDECEPGAYIFNEGEGSHAMYVVKEGKVALEMLVRIGTRTKRQAVIDVIGRGEVFGWSAISDKPVRSMSALCTAGAKLLAFDGEEIRRLFDEDTGMARNVMDEVINLVENRLSNTKQTLAHVLSVTSHDLRAPLATVQSCLDTLIGGFAGSINERQRELLEGGRARISDLTKMIDNILDISYIEIRKRDFTDVNIRAVVESSLDDVQGMAQQKGIKLTNRVPHDTPHILGVPPRLRQALTNLLSNAVKFTSEEGHVIIGFHDSDDSIQLDVCDTGIGIAPEEQPRIFDDFYRGSTQDVEGAGLGLSISKRIIESHGGVIWVESPCPETETGTRFSFTLPKISPQATDIGEEEPVKPETVNILVTDDDPEMRRIVSLVLESQGYLVTTAKDGEEALVRIAEERPDLLILDLLIPKMDGFEVCKRLDEQVEAGESWFPILVLTAVREDTSRRRYELETEEDLNVEGYVEKPVSPPLLLQRVASILKEARSRK
ncbi:MAG TPA: hybrid sensor histidine kinase/response regulator [Dehalococcoidia bacterium]|nr:hybrid sensor histidine kinase/response regulator [Dehalococcoidia bacterium]